ncbi:DUF2637 domain-containing protein, partial [Streptomyces sp. NPDC006925]|uniref:DUF2637 domain-containing protein n=1 Tax=Streptomyces sp. NPDC006925 TaxID=3364768 RepID=UPI0036C2A281
MANDQSVNTPSHWSAAADVGPVDWRGTAERAITDAPAWVLAAVAGGVLIVALVFGFALWSRASKRRAEREQYHRDLVAQAREDGQPLPPEPLQMDYKPLLGGFAVSLHGLWGFATQTADLSFFFAIGFMSMFDILQLRLFSQMFRMADPRKGWTRPMRVMRATAWCFVLLSAVANFQHAPNIWSAPWLAAMPIGAAWVIQVPLKNALDSDDPEEQEKRPEGVKPGPLRLIGLLWRRLWAYFFRKAGLDVTDRADEMVRRARARDAADASYALRGVLTEKQELELAVERATTPGLDGKPMSRGQLQQAQKRLVALNKELKTKVRPRAQSALELADTQDPEQGLQLMQRMAWLTNADDVAMLDYGPESPAMEKLEQLNIAANADFVKSSKRARSAEDAAAEAERRMDAAEQKVTEAQEQLDEVLGRLESAEKEATEEQDRLQKAVEERERLEESDTRADQLYRQVKEELDRTREQLQTLQEERTELSTSSGRVQERLEALVQERDQLAEKAHEAKEELDRTRGQLQTL